MFTSPVGVWWNAAVDRAATGFRFIIGPLVPGSGTGRSGHTHTHTHQHTHTHTEDMKSQTQWISFQVGTRLGKPSGRRLCVCTASGSWFQPEIHCSDYWWPICIRACFSGSDPRPTPWGFSCNSKRGAGSCLFIFLFLFVLLTQLRPTVKTVAMTTKQKWTSVALDVVGHQWKSLDALEQQFWSVAALKEAHHCVFFSDSWRVDCASDQHSYT